MIGNIKYTTISPDVLKNIVMNTVPNAFCYTNNFNEDYFEFGIYGRFSPMNNDEWAQVEEILAQYV